MKKAIKGKQQNQTARQEECPKPAEGLKEVQKIRTQEKINNIKLTKKKIAVFITAGVLIVILSFYGADKIVNSAAQNKLNDKYRHVLEIWLADPDSVSVIDENINITEEFFSKYGDSILNGDFVAAVNEMSENMDTVSYSVTYKNKHLFD